MLDIVLVLTTYQGILGNAGFLGLELVIQWSQSTHIWDSTNLLGYLGNKKQSLFRWKNLLKTQLQSFAMLALMHEHDYIKWMLMTN